MTEPRLWRAGERCVLVCLNSRDGDPIKPGRVEAIHGRHVVVATDDGGRYHVGRDSSFLQRPPREEAGHGAQA